MLLRLEQDRKRLGTKPAIQSARTYGQASPQRSPADRKRLRTLIRIADRILPGTNCFRRVLWESACDAGAAAEPILIGLVSGGGPDSGHAWFASAESPDTSRYTSVFSL